MTEKMKRPKKQEIYAPADVKIPSRLGGGVLKERVIRDLLKESRQLCVLAYINPLIFSASTGGVLGYDNSHDYSHRHFMGTIVADPFISYEELYERFEREWQEIAIKFVNGEEI